MDNPIKIIPNFISEEDRLKVIELLSTHSLVPFKGYDTVFIIPLIESETEANDLLKKYSKKAIEHHNSGDLYPVEGWLYVWKVGAKAALHIDDYAGFEFLSHSIVIYMNDDYEGGEIYFPNFDFKYKPKAGDAVLFPSDGETFIHGVTEITKGNRYTIAMWHTPVKEEAHPLIK